jgi:DNA processing protein
MVALFPGSDQMSPGPDNSIRDWIALTYVTGVGSRTAAMLIDRFGSPSACFEAGAGALESLGLKRATVEEIKSAAVRERAARQLEELSKAGAQVLTLADQSYPALLRETYDPPIVLYFKGDFARALARPSIAVVGSRHCSTYGRNVAEMLARELACRGVTIISGLARGIDSAAHRGALDGGGLTVAVMGTGLDNTYPKENRSLAERIARQGALVTEFPLGTPPLSQNFPFRNRVISGLALGVLIIEGAERSGSLITARMAYEQGRDVFAVPGNITSAKSFGPNYLIKDGAKLVQTWRDIVEEFPLEVKAEILASEIGETAAEQLVMDEVALTEAERKILSLIKSDEPVHIDILLSTAGLASGELMGALLRLEMMERVRQLPGKSFVRKL